MPEVHNASPATQPKEPIRRRGRRRDRTQALKIQAILTDTICNPKTEPASRASCAAAWARVQEARRILEGKPLPGQLRPDLAQLAGPKRIGPPARTAQRISIVPKPSSSAEPKAVVSPQDQSIPFGQVASQPEGGHPPFATQSSGHGGP